MTPTFGIEADFRTDEGISEEQKVTLRNMGLSVDSDVVGQTNRVTISGNTGESHCEEVVREMLREKLREVGVFPLD